MNLGGTHADGVPQHDATPIVRAPIQGANLVYSVTVGTRIARTHGYWAETPSASIVRLAYPKVTQVNPISLPKFESLNLTPSPLVPRKMCPFLAPKIGADNQAVKRVKIISNLF